MHVICGFNRSSLTELVEAQWSDLATLLTPSLAAASAELFCQTTVKVLSIGTDRSEKTVQTQNRLVRVYTVCYSIPTFLGRFWQCKTIPLNFYNNNGNHDSVPIFRIFTVTQNEPNDLKVLENTVRI